MTIKMFLVAIAMLSIIPEVGYSSVFSKTDQMIFSCGSANNRHHVDRTLFPKTLRVDGTFIELQSSTSTNNGFNVGIYKQKYGLANAMFAVREGYKPVLIKSGETYVCD